MQKARMKLGCLFSAWCPLADLVLPLDRTSYSYGLTLDTMGCTSLNSLDEVLERKVDTSSKIATS